MDLKKVLDQTVRDIKREVNKKVLKVPEIEQKVLDATSNEPWGPHGTLMAEIAQATRNFNECQMVMNILWKRVNDTGRNWRHVYKALTVLEYLVANGSERVIDELHEHTYQISALSDFQYVEPNGKDQGINVRKKVQNISSLINDKERIQEVRQKAEANRDKYRGLSSTGVMHKPSSYSSTGGGYNGNHYDEDHHRYGQARDTNGNRYKDERYGKDGDWQTRDGDRYGNDGGDRYSMDTDRYRDDDFGGDRGYKDERYNHKGGDRRHDKERGRAYDDDDHYSSRSRGGKGEDCTLDERTHVQKQSQWSLGAPPSYSESINKMGDRNNDERAGGGLATTVAKTCTQASSASPSVQNVATSSTNQDENFDDFNPRGLSTVGVAASAAIFTDDFFSQTSGEGLSNVHIELPTSTGATVASPSVSVRVPSTGVDLFADASFSSAFVAPSASAVLSQNQLNGDHFGDSLFKTSFHSSEDLFAAQTPDLFEGNSVSALETSIPQVQDLKTPNPFQTQAQPLVSGVTQVPATTQQQSRHQDSQDQNSITTVPSKPEKHTDKFEPKSAIWADPLSRGLIDLNISGPKSNLLADIGINLNSMAQLEGRKEEEKKISTVSMGKAMGTGSGLGRAGASTLAPLPGPHMTGLMGTAGYGLGMMAGPGMGITSAMGMPGTVAATGMPLGPSMGATTNFMMSTGQGDLTNPQQQFGGFR